MKNGGENPIELQQAFKNGYVCKCESITEFFINFPKINVIMCVLQGNANSERKGALDSLTHDELLRKCKGLLGILKNAKKAKDG